jgi:predicted N-formylglutamate amidohydrolase
MADAPRLLSPDEPPPVTVYNDSGASPFFIVADHAGNAFPRALGRLGLAEPDCARHIAWDIGIAAVSRLLAEALDAPLVQQNYSRLVIDCNRAPGSDSSIPDISELTPIPGNIGLSDAQRAARACEIFAPYHDRIARELARRREAQMPTALVSMHSFTPVFKGVARPWRVGVLSNRDRRLADVLIALMRREEGLVVGDNEPYSLGDLTDYTVPVHAERAGLPHVMIEIRQDLISDDAGQRAFALRFAQWLPQALSALAEADLAQPA